MLRPIVMTVDVESTGEFDLDEFELCLLDRAIFFLDVNEALENKGMFTCPLKACVFRHI